MACVEIPSANVDSEMEEGEIVDDVDELSDISSEEEFLLRQRLEVLENYNNVLERKQAKKKSRTPCNGKQRSHKEIILCDLSEVSETDLDDKNIYVSQKFIKRAVRPHKRKKQNKNSILKKIKDCKKKSKQNKRKSTSEVHIKSSDDSEDEYINKRRKLAEAVTLRRNRIDTSTLKDRINRMLFGMKPKAPSNIIQLKQSSTLPSYLEIHSGIKNIQDNSNNVNQIQSEDKIINNDKLCYNTGGTKMELDNVKPDDILIKVNEQTSTVSFNESINLCTDNESSQDVVVLDSAEKNKEENSKEVINGHDSDNSSDEDLELLREYALKTKPSKSKAESLDETDLELLREYALKSKSSKSKAASLDEKITINNQSKNIVATEDEDSDTAELRLICLKSTLLKKAIEMKQKQKLRKRLSQSSCLSDDLTLQKEILNAQSENNTDIESVDMDIGSEGEEKAKENSNVTKADTTTNDIGKGDKNKIKEDELEEDEDLLRAKLLTSLSKNLPNLIDLNIFDKGDKDIENIQKENIANVPVAEEKKIIITLGQSDSEGENEATKNLTKMHMKLAEHYQDFQSKLDYLLKSTRKEFEKESLPDVVQKSVPQKPTEKFVPKAMTHLPKSEQIEYRNLVRRMVELEKIKQARNAIIVSQSKIPVKDTLKPRNVSLNGLKSTNDVEEKIAQSRKKIAEESAKILRLKDEAKKLTQKYKIVATELKNISTAITINKKQQRAVHSNLQKIRLQHQLLLKGSNYNFNARNQFNKMPLLNKIQKENNPTAKATSYFNALKSFKVSVVNDGIKDGSAIQSRLSVQLDVSNNRKPIKLPKSGPKGRVVDIVPNKDSNNPPIRTEREPDTTHPIVEKGGGESFIVNDVHITPKLDHSTKSSMDDYKSPLDALGNATWSEDPNAFLCPYEVGGSCRDPECKYLHPKIQS